MQATRTAPTPVRHQLDDGIHALDGHERPVVSLMTRLATRLASTLHATATLSWATGKAIG
jgi:hypothetical protein